MTTQGSAGATPGLRMLGEIVAWSGAEATIPHLELLAALRGSGLDEAVARAQVPGFAYASACQKLADAGILYEVVEEAATIQFQITAEPGDDGRCACAVEPVVVLEKATGKVMCEVPGLAALAQERLDQCLEAHTGADVRDLIQKLFEGETDIFPLSHAGNVFFCPQEYVGCVDRIQAFLTRLHSGMNRFPIPAGTPHGDRAVKALMAAVLATLIAEHQDAVARFGAEANVHALGLAAEHLRRTAVKVEAYAGYLAEERARLEEALVAVSRQLQAKLERWAGAAAEVPGAGVTRTFPF